MSEKNPRSGGLGNLFGYRQRLILLVALPSLLLGGSYFLLLEFVLGGDGEGASSPIQILRIAGGVFIFLALLLSLGVGMVVVGRMTQPLRHLLGLVESETESAQTARYLYDRDRDAFYLYRRIQALVGKAREGAVAQTKLDRLSRSVDGLREKAAALTGVVDERASDVSSVSEDEGEVRATELIREIEDGLSESGRELDTFREEVRVQVREVRAGLEVLRFCVADQAGGPASSALGRSPELDGESWSEQENQNGSHDTTENEVVRDLETVGEPAVRVEAAVEAAARKIRQWGTVTVLEMERVSPESEGLGVRYQRFVEGIDELESALAALAGNSQVVPTAEEIDADARWFDEAMTRWDQLEDILGNLEQRLDEVRAE